MFENSKNATETFKAEISRLKTELKRSYISSLKRDMVELKYKFPNLDVIYIIGTTPEWNDGEECLHSTEIFVESLSNYGGIGEVFEILYDCYDINNQEELDQHVPVELHHVNKKLSKKESNEIEDILNSNRIPNQLETVLETNWKIFIDFRQEEIILTVEDYDRGY